jgi:phosphate transport system permease protein
MLSLVVILLGVVLVNGLGVFWPTGLSEVTLAGGNKLLCRIIRHEVNPDTGRSSVQVKTANRELDPQRQDFRWIQADAIRATAQPADACVLERIENGDFYGYVKGVAGPDLPPRASPPTLGEGQGVNAESPHARPHPSPRPEGEGTSARPHAAGEGTKAAADRSSGVPVAEALSIALDCVRRKSAAEIAPISAELFALSHELHESRDKLVRLKYRSQSSAIALGKVAGPKSSLPLGAGTNDRQIAQLEAVSQRIKEKSDRLVSRQQQRLAALRRNVVLMSDAAGRETPVALADVVRFYQPNAMGFFGKCGHYLSKVGELLWDNPRESNTEGGLFPAIFGTVMLIFLMAVTCFPLGVLTGVYLGEYAKDGLLVRLVRIAVNNLAGIPSIVYGIFGLGFFVYGVGGLLDQWFFPERVAAGTPTFGTGGILWASLTLGLLTVPVVIVATEEALRAIPRATREGSFALGATKFQTLLRVLLPMASPGMMTGFILAMARAAGEVAPLMITGVVKLAPQMPVDGVFPYFHLERKFMHLGFHVYDVGFQSPNVEASKPMVFVTTLLLLAIVLAMTSVAIYLRNRMRKLYLVRTI